MVSKRGFLDHGVQVTLVRRELLPVIGEKHGWSPEERHKRKLQPVGAMGTNLGVIALVSLDIQVDKTGMVKEVPCYVLFSEKPIFNCGLVLAPVSLGLK